MSRTTNFTLSASIVLPAAVFFWEHFARKANTRIRPSFIINGAARWLTKAFAKVGELTARISSFYTKVNVKELMLTANELLNPTFALVAAPSRMITSYIETASSYPKTALVFFGTVTLAGAGMFSVLRYPELRRVLESKLKLK